MHYGIDITTVQSFRYIERIDAKIWISKNASCRVFANGVTYVYRLKPITGKVTEIVKSLAIGWPTLETIKQVST